MVVNTLKQELLETYPWRIELHAHTNPVSGCSEIPPEELVQRYAAQGYHGIVITNHFTPALLDWKRESALKYYLDDYYKAKDAGQKYGIQVYLGAELLFADSRNDYLLFGADEQLIKKCTEYLHGSVTQFRQEFSLPDSVFLQAHPFRNDMVFCDPAILDGMECLNLHPNHNSRVGVATLYAHQAGLPIKTAGSDSHHPGQEALCALRTPYLPEDSFDIAKILKSGDYIFDIGRDSIWIP